MTKLLSVSLLSIAALLPSPRRPRCCARSDPTPRHYDSMADMPASAAAQNGAQEGHDAALSEGLRKGVAVRQRDVAQRGDGERRRRRLEDRVPPQLRESPADELRSDRHARHLRARARPSPEGDRQSAGVDEGGVGQRAARRRVGGLRDGEGGADAIAPAGGAAGDVDLSVDASPGRGPRAGPSSPRATRSAAAGSCRRSPGRAPSRPPAATPARATRPRARRAKATRARTNRRAPASASARSRPAARPTRTAATGAPA